MSDNPEKRLDPGITMPEGANRAAWLSARNEAEYLLAGGQIGAMVVAKETETPPGNPLLAVQQALNRRDALKHG